MSTLNDKNKPALVIGDLHGRNVWKAVNPLNYSEIIFVGDYVDSFDLHNETILQNLEDLITFKKQTEKQICKVTLLLGNHDLQYALDSNFNRSPFICSGFRHSMFGVLNRIFKENKDDFKIAARCHEYLITHAGVTDAWVKTLLNNSDSKRFGFDKIDLCESLNMMYETSLIYYFANVSYIRGGSYPIGGSSCMWADYISEFEYYQPINQIFGHTSIDEIWIDKKHDAKIICVDCLHKSNEFLEVYKNGDLVVVNPDGEYIRKLE